MCGIHVSATRSAFQAPSDGLKKLLSSRGPDHIGDAKAEIYAEDGATYFISLTSTVLALRGGQVQAQPFHDSASGCFLCWNGEAWKVDSSPVVGNDGQLVFRLLSKASSSHLSTADSLAAVLKVLRSIAGPFAFVFLDTNHGQLYFGRDCLGRRSLLYNTDASTTMEFSSCADSASSDWKEVEADGIYQLSFDNQSMNSRGNPTVDVLPDTLVPCQRHSWQDFNHPSSNSNLSVFNKSLPSHQQALNLQSPSVKQLHKLLLESLKLRVLNVLIPPGQNQDQKVRVAVLFSGGLDCTVLARLAHDVLPTDQEIDLLNVAFENPRTINAASKVSQPKKQKIASAAVPELDAIDGTVVPAAMSCYELCPDRETGRKAFQELRNVCPGRLWRFVAVDVPYKETLAHRAKVVGLISPHNTEMDLSIAYALYFTSRGTGTVSTDAQSDPLPYRTPARVLLSGLGADELFGGYTRHTTAFRRNGYPGLVDELELDVNRLGRRNLGRDDRVISSWGREARFPYLDEALVKWAVELPVWEKCGFQEVSPDEPELTQVGAEKKVLRLLAYGLGMHSVAVEKKRAIQFGARTAKMETGRTKGTALIS